MPHAATFLLGLFVGSFATSLYLQLQERRRLRRAREALDAEVAPMVLALLRNIGREWTTTAALWTCVRPYARASEHDVLLAVSRVLGDLEKRGDVEARTGEPRLGGSISPVEFRPTPQLLNTTGEPAR